MAKNVPTIPNTIPIIAPVSSEDDLEEGEGAGSEDVEWAEEGEEEGDDVEEDGCGSLEEDVIASRC